MTQQVPAGMVAQTLHIPAGLGIDQATRAEHVQPGAANLMQVNVRMMDRQALEKRKGFTALATTLAGFTSEGFTSRSDGIKMFAHGKQTCVIDDDGNLDTHAWDKTTNVLQTRIPRLSTETIFAAPCGDISAVPGDGDVAHCDITICNEFYLLCSWESNGTTRFPIIHVVDKSTRALLKTVRGFATWSATYGSALKIASVGSKAFLCHTNASANIYITVLDCASLATLETSLNAWAAGAGATTVATDWLQTGLDMCATATRLYVFYANNSGGATAGTVKAYTASTMALAVSDTITTTAAVQACAIDGSDSDNIWLAWSRAGSTDVFVHGRQASNFINISGSTSAVLGGVTGVPFGIGIRRVSSVGGYVIAGFQDSATDSMNMSQSVAFYASGGATTFGGRVLQNMGYVPVTQPFVIGNFVYANCAFTDQTVVGLSVTAFKIGELTSPLGTLDFDNPALPCASPMRGNSALAGPGLNGFYPSHVPVADTYGVAWIVPVAMNAAGGAYCVIECRTDRTERLYHRAEHNGVTYLSGAQTYCYDGARAYEAGFVCPPIVKATVTAGAGLEIGTYVYTAIHEWCDAEGNVVWSEPARVATVTTTSGNQTVRVKVCGATATGKNYRHFSSTREYTRHVRTLVFRTKMGGGPFYLQSTRVVFDPAGSGALSATFTDSTSDSSLGSNRKLYTQPGLPGQAQSRRTPPSSIHIGKYGDMLIAIADDGRTIWPSGQRVVGEAAWWGDAFQIPGVADLVGTMEMDGTLYVFARGSIHAMTGEAPSDNGLAGGLGQPRLVCASSGCIDARSLVRTEAGIFFRSTKGIEVLGRDGSVSFVGEQVWREVDTCPYTTSAVYDPRNNVVIFTLAKQQTGGFVYPTPAGSPEVSYSRRLVFDMSSGVWCSLDKMRGVTAASDVTAQSADIVWNGTLGEYVYAWQEGIYYGVVHVENNAYLDASAYPIVSEWSTPWIKLEAQADHQFYQGVLRIERDGDVGLAVDCYYDWSDTLGETKTWTSAVMASYPKQVELRPQASQQAVRFVLRDTYAGVFGDSLGGLNFIGLSFDIGLFKGPNQGVPRIAVAARR